VTEKKTDDAAGDEAEPKEKPKAYYCPGCGTQYDEQGTCEGPNAESPHAPIETVSTKELSGDPEKQTAAPNTGDVNG
jgi:hypothetical protein